MQTLLLALCAVAHAAPSADLVISLPGWAGALKSPMYSGYVEVEGMPDSLHLVIRHREGLMMDR